jgi:exosortase family protein XrtF
LKNQYQQFKPFLLFLGKFLLSYLLLTFLYHSYLSQFDDATFQVDCFTKIVANQTKSVMQLFGCEAATQVHQTEKCVKLFYNNKWIARIIEGCNALSVIILFVSFVISFSGKIKQTIVYIVVGSLLIHIMNVIRIALLAVLIFNYPQYESFLHGIFFPLIIYGFVFLLWVYWVNNFSKYATKSSK